MRWRQFISKLSTVRNATGHKHVLRALTGFLVLAVPVGVAAAWSSSGSGDVNGKPANSNQFSVQQEKPMVPDNSANNSSHVKLNVHHSASGMASTQSHTTNVSSTVSSSAGSSDNSPTTKVTVNGQDIAVPANGTVNRYLSGDGNLNVSVDSSGSTNSSSSLNVNVQSSSDSESTSQ